MTKRDALILLGLTCFAFGVHGASPAAEVGGGWIERFLMVLLLVSLFAWLGADRREHGHARSIWMNLGIVFFSLLAIPVYLASTRPRGLRAGALRGYALAVLGALGAAFLGGMTGTLLSLRAGES